MNVGVPRETKTDENRVGLTPSSVRELVVRGHRVLVESRAGEGIGMDDLQYQRAGGQIVAGAAELYSGAQLIVKVKEPQPAERRRLRPGQILFTYLHLAPDPEQARELRESGASCIAYETVSGRNGGLPLLAPMSEIAGRLAVQAGAHFLEKTHGGAGVLLGSVPGVEPAKVAILGGGVAGSHAAAVAAGMGAEVVVLDNSLPALRALWQQLGDRARTVYATRASIEKHCLEADLIVGSVLVPGAAAPKLVDAALVRQLRKGAVLVDVAIDQGGCFETSRPTTHREPTYVVDGVVHYCVTNMPGAVARTSTIALNNATLPYVIELADRGLAAALGANRHFLDGLNVHRGAITNSAVASSLGMPLVDAREAIDA